MNLKILQKKTHKICTKCKEKKTLLDYHVSTTATDGRASQCICCIQKSVRTIDGVINAIYNGQISSSKARKHPMPTYTQNEIGKWLNAQSLFKHLYNAWVTSGYKKDLKPSVDRTDSKKPYSFDNITLMTWKENQDKEHTQEKLGNAIACKAVRQLDLDGNIINEYPSITIAAKAINTSITNISQACKNYKYSACGFKWKRIDQTDSKEEV